MRTPHPLRIRRALIVALAVLALSAAALPVSSADDPPQVVRGLTVPAGFAATVFAHTPPGMLPTSLTWAQSTAPAGARAGELHGIRLYVTTLTGHVIAYEDEGAVPTVVADGLQQPLGIVMGPDETLYVSENADNRGRVTALSDGDGDGVFESRATVIANLPNGRHQTNGLTFGPDGMLYVANGNATDDGVECGPALVPGGSEDDCPAPEVVPWSGSILRVDPSWRDVDLLADVRVDGDGVPADDGLDDEGVLVARGFRNIYDVAFDPRDPTTVWTPMNGSDNPSSSEPLYAVDTVNSQQVGTVDGQPLHGPVIENAGFPSCLYDPHDNPFPLPDPFGHEHPGALEPENNPNQAVIDEFGPCDRFGVLPPKWIFDEGHEGTSGMAFTEGSNFPERYAGDLFVAEWGSIWNLNGATVTGHKIVRFELDEDRNVLDEREFMTGVMPIDLTFGPGGHLYVADMEGTIYEVEHVTDAATPDVVTVDMTNGQFVPQVVAITQGQTVRWVNTDATPHTVTNVAKVVYVDPLGAESPVQDGPEMNSPGPVAPGAEHSFMFLGEVGTYHYHSTTSGTESNTMRGTIVVLPVER